MKPPAFAASSPVNATQSPSAMQFTTSIALLAALATQACAAVLPHAAIVVDKMYDVPTTSLQATACSTGENGLLSRYPTFGDIPNYPFIGGAFAVEGFNSTNCGSCWELTFLQQDGKTNVVHVTAVNTAPPEEFVISLEAQEALTGATDESHVPANVIAAFREVAPSFCGLD